jgi:hypothetical protein
MPKEIPATQDPAPLNFDGNATIPNALDTKTAEDNGLACGETRTTVNNKTHLSSQDSQPYEPERGPSVLCNVRITATRVDVKGMEFKSGKVEELRWEPLSYNTSGNCPVCLWRLCRDIKDTKDIKTPRLCKGRYRSRIFALTPSLKLYLCVLQIGIFCLVFKSHRVERSG